MVESQPTPPAAPAERGLKVAVIGAQSTVHVVNRARYLAELGHAVTLITHEPHGEEVKGVALVRPNPRLGPIRRALDLYHLLRGTRADLLYVHFAWGLAAWATLAAGRGPVAVNVMGGDLMEGNRGPHTRVQRWLTRQLLRRAGLVTCKSQRLAQTVRALGVPPERVQPMVWGVDPEQFRRVETGALRRELGLEPQDVPILSPRVLQRFYGIDLIVAAMPRVLSACPRAKFLICEFSAEPGYKRELVAQIERLSLRGAVRFVGTIDHGRMPQFYSLAEAVVSVPPTDGFPQSLLEALSCGVPAVLSQVPSYLELVEHGRSAWLVERTAEAIAAGVTRVLTDTELRRRLAAEGRRVVLERANLRSELARLDVRLRELARRGPSRRIRAPERAVLLAVTLVACLQDRWRQSGRSGASTAAAPAG